jgi:hypothetical protein
VNHEGSENDGDSSKRLHKSSCTAGARIVKPGQSSPFRACCQLSRIFMLLVHKNVTP